MKREKALTKQRYMTKFSRAVRWRLPPQESEEAIADYRELVYQEERDESKLAEELGDPVQAAHLLADVKTYRRWLAVFAVLAYGLFLLAKWVCMAHSPFTYIFGYERWWYPVWVMAVGVVLSLVWFRRHGQKNGPLSKWLLLALGVVLIAGCWVLYELWDVSGATFLEQVSDSYWKLRQQSRLVVSALMYVGAFAALAGLGGLVAARCQDRRWLALYILGLTVAAMFGFVVFNLKSMNIEYGDNLVLRAYLFARLIPIGAVGLIGTGVSLC